MVFFKVLVQHFHHNESQYDDHQSWVRLHWRRWWMQYIPSINLIYCLWHSAVLKMQNFVKHARRSFRAKSKIRNKSWPVITISRGIKQVVFYIKIFGQGIIRCFLLPHFSWFIVMGVKALSEAPYPILFWAQMQWKSGLPSSNTYISYI